jgi:hypothetical protein
MDPDPDPGGPKHVDPDPQHWLNMSGSGSSLRLCLKWYGNAMVLNKTLK